MTPEEIAEGRKLLEANRGFGHLRQHYMIVRTGDSYLSALLAWLGNHTKDLLAAAEECLRLREENAALKADLKKQTDVLDRLAHKEQFIDDMEGG